MFSLRKLLPASGNDSLHRFMNQIDDLETRFSEALASYKAALDSLAEHAPAALKALLEDFRKELRKLRTGLGSTPNGAALTDVRKDLDGALKAYGRAVEQHTRRHEEEAKQVMAMLAVMAESIAGQEKQYNVRFRGIAKKLRLLITSQDLSEIRQKLSAEVSQLEKYVEDMSRDTQAALERVQTELATVRRRPEAADRWANLAVDPVTSLPGRAQGQVAIDTRMRSHTRFCVGRFVVLGFANIRERHGREPSDGVAQAFASRLRAQFREQDIICRWDEDEFVVIVDCQLPELAGRVTEIERALSGLYDGVGIAASCAGGAIEPFRGESSAQMLDRLRQAMTAGAVR
jgi:GGDEF domain-containing protein